MGRITARSIATLAILAACGTEDRGMDSFGSSASQSSESQTGVTGGSEDATGGTGATTAEAETGGIKLDVGAATTTAGCLDPDGDCGCTAVDILFVIDNSGSMCFYQEGLAMSFASFVDAMYEALPSGTDLHVGITTSGFELGGSHSESNCVPQESQAVMDQYYTRPGEGMVNGNGLQGRLLDWNGQRFFAVDTSDPNGKQGLQDWFSGGAISVDCGVSSFEFNASGAAWALHPDNEATNSGFLRDEGAVLLIFILSDEADQSLEMETLDFLHDTVVEAKSGCGGDACIITGGLLGPWCIPDQNAAYQFMATFGEDPVWGDIGDPCLFNCVPPDYSEILGDALAQVVAQTCDEIPPEG